MKCSKYFQLNVRLLKELAAAYVQGEHKQNMKADPGVESSGATRAQPDPESVEQAVMPKHIYISW